MDKPFVSIVFPTYNNREWIKKCLSSIRKLDYPRQKTEIIVVDNASTDGTFELIKSKFPEVFLIRLETNKGPAGGCNAGFKVAKGRYVLRMDDDVILDKNCLRELVRVAEVKRKVGGVGPKIYYYDKPDVLQSIGGEINWEDLTFRVLGAFEEDVGQYERVREVDWQISCAVLMNKKVLNEVGLYDERIFWGGEENDWCVRAKKAGYRFFYAPKAKVWHRSVSAPERMKPIYIYYSTRNSLLIKKKYGRIVPRIHLRNIFYMIKLFLRSLLRFKKDEKFAEALGILDFYLGRFGKREI